MVSGVQIAVAGVKMVNDVGKYLECIMNHYPNELLTLTHAANGNASR